MTEFEGLANAGIRALRAYDPGHDLVALRRAAAPARLVELGSNENPYGASPKAKQAIVDVLAGLHIYPDPLGGDLKRALAAKHGVDAANLLLGNGTHELLMQLAQVFAGPDDEVVASQYGFAVYALAAQATGATLRLASALPRDAAMPRGHDLDALRAAIGPRTKLVYLANPNNPTGTWFGDKAFEDFLAGVPEHVLVVVDEAYAEFVDAPEYASALALVARHPNLIVTRTFSKAYALAGLRVGYAVAHPQLIAVMERVRESFNVNALGLAAAEAALADAAHLAASVAGNREQRQALAEALRARGLAVSPSQTNFLLVEFGDATAYIEAALVERGVILRPMGGYGLGDCLRITVGTADENARLLAALDEVMA
ncbi:histidinol-phosphate transaminase [Thermomonas brevis]|uniref:Histidinol-phosphate aminotransferase n=1 Tax=Thermomonas brevis TaxID=215691 RepID=A0A7G9QTE4_9GAMM|nr:histidinol-phosphate transaminase [Thermomonas brevis]QNN46619.1 histidinol-phosphate transaminase [Thermomonas brevis]